MAYAFDELQALARSLPPRFDLADPTFWYCSALVAQLAYYHVEQFEIDERKRAKLVPSDIYQAMLAAGTQPSVIAVLGAMGISEGEGPGQAFVVVTRGMAAVGFTIADKLFIGMRGTIFFSAFDWVRNFSIWKTDKLGDRYHGGFYSEADWICEKLRPYVEPVLKSGRKVIFCGHSLGGAVAAVSAEIFASADPSIALTSIRACIFGAPRYRKTFPPAACGAPWCPLCSLVVHIRRRGDKVPDVVPRVLGYADVPMQFDVSGTPIGRYKDRWGSGFKDSAKFAATLARDHAIERYWREVGRRSRAQNWQYPFINGFALLGGRDVLVTSRAWRKHQGLP